MPCVRTWSACLRASDHLSGVPWLSSPMLAQAARKDRKEGKKKRRKKERKKERKREDEANALPVDHVCSVGKQEAQKSRAESVLVCTTWLSTPETAKPVRATPSSSHLLSSLSFLQSFFVGVTAQNAHRASRGQGSEAKEPHKCVFCTSLPPHQPLPSFLLFLSLSLSLSFFFFLIKYTTIW